MHNGHRLTNFFPLPNRYFGYTAMDWFKFYAFIALSCFALAYVYSKELNLLDDIQNKPAGEQAVIALIMGSAIVLVLPVILGFVWWASGALVKYSKWQLRNPVLWQIFWMVSLLFLAIVFLDPLDYIHPNMSKKGMVPMPNIIAMFEGRGWWEKVMNREWDKVLFQFQLGYATLWFMFWFLVVIAHWQYFLDGLREAWFYINRFHRYGGSVLTGFRETGRTMTLQPVTGDYPHAPAELPQSYRGAPLLAVDKLTEEQAAAIIAADESGSVVSAPGQPTVLFIDLGKYEYSPALADLRDSDGRPLLRFEGGIPAPSADRAELVVPLSRPGTPLEREPAQPEADTEQDGGGA